MDLELYRNALRAFLKDHQDLNRLLKFEEESSDDKLDLYLNMALGFLNSVPPPVAAYSIGNFPVPSLLIHQGAIEALISNSILQSRNELTYNNGGITVKMPDGRRYESSLRMLYEAVGQELKMFSQMKVGININGCWGGVHSPYAYLAGNPYLTGPYDGLQ